MAKYRFFAGVDPVDPEPEIMCTKINYPEVVNCLDYEELHNLQPQLYTSAHTVDSKTFTQSYASAYTMVFESKPSILVEFSDADRYGSKYTPNEIAITFKSYEVKSKRKKLRAKWTPELSQDLETYYSIDAEAKLTALLSEEINAEIDREIIKDIKIKELENEVFNLKFNNPKLYKFWYSNGNI